MKKVILMVVASVVTVSVLAYVVKKEILSKTAKVALSNITLNGLSEVDANNEVANFVDDNTAYSKTISIWLDKNWVDNVYAILKGEVPTGADPNSYGIRIYFAKKADGKNTVVLVSTKPDNTGNNVDYFDHSSSAAASFLNNNEANVQEYYNMDNGANLYKPASAFSCSNSNCDTNDKNYISCDTAHAYVYNFMNQKSQTINTYSEWFSLGVFEKISDDLSAETIQNPKTPADGIRIYFAKAGNIPVHTKQKNRHCFILITTRTVNNVLRQDYYECYESGNSLVHGNDNGEQCPNNCGGVTLPQ